MDKISILIADDEPLIRLDIREMLESAGYEVFGEAENGLKALDLVKGSKVKPDLAILDIKMPGLNGLEVAKALETMNIPVILLTAYNHPKLVSRAEKVSVYTYLVKPITERDLFPAIQIAYARWKEKEKLNNELKQTKLKLYNQKLISHAKAILAKEGNISEYDAHQQLLKEAMRLRVTVEARAKQIIEKNTK